MGLEFIKYNANIQTSDLPSDEFKRDETRESTRLALDYVHLISRGRGPDKYVYRSSTCLG
jgi:hypothetical protein